MTFLAATINNIVIKLNGLGGCFDACTAKNRAADQRAAKKNKVFERRANIHCVSPR